MGKSCGKGMEEEIKGSSKNQNTLNHSKHKCNFTPIKYLVLRYKLPTG